MAESQKNLFQRLFPFWTSEGVPGRAKTRPYSRLWWYTVLLTSGVAILPLLIITAISYYQYREAFVEEMLRPAQHLTSTRTASDLIRQTLDGVLFGRTSSGHAVPGSRSFF